MENSVPASLGELQTHQSRSVVRQVRVRSPVAIVIPSILVTLLFTACGGSSGPAPVASPPTLVSVETARHEVLSEPILAIGRVSALAQVEVASEVAGRVVEINFESGQTVNKGDVLARLDVAAEAAEKRRALRYADYSERVLAREERLRELGISQSRLDEVQLNIDIAEHDANVLDAEISRRTIVAPFSGRLGIRKIFLGQIVASKEPIVTLTDTSVLHVNFGVPEKYYTKVSVGQVLDVEIPALGESAYQGTIVAMDPQLSKDTRMLNVQAEFRDDSGKVLHGMFAGVAIRTTSSEKKVVIPAVAVQSSTYGFSVFVVEKDGENEIAVRRNIKTGDKFAGNVVVEEGVEVGEAVIVFGQHRLRDRSVVQSKFQEGTPLVDGS